jgi:hypothetical protein
MNSKPGDFPEAPQASHPAAARKRDRITGSARQENFSAVWTNLKFVLNSCHPR